jgi:hypothetical protein
VRWTAAQTPVLPNVPDPIGRAQRGKVFLEIPPEAVEPRMYLPDLMGAGRARGPCTAGHRRPQGRVNACAFNRIERHFTGLSDIPRHQVHLVVETGRDCLASEPGSQAWAWVDIAGLGRDDRRRFGFLCSVMVAAHLEFSHISSEYAVTCKTSKLGSESPAGEAQETRMR